MNKFIIFTIIAIPTILISGVIPYGEQPVWYAQYLALTFFLFLGISLSLWDFNKYLSIFTFVCLFSTFFITNLSPRAIILLIQLDMVCLASYGISKFNKQQRQWILCSIFGIILLQFVWLILQAWDIRIPFKIGNQISNLTFSSIYNQGHCELVGFSGAKDQLGSFFALTAPIALSFSPFAILLSLVGVFISKSSFAFMALTISSFVYLFFTKNKIFIPVVVAIALIVSIIFFSKAEKLNKADFQTRFGVWNYAIKSVVNKNINIEMGNRKLQVKCNPLFGYGFGNFLTIFPFVPQGSNQFNCVNEKFTHAHNDYIEGFFELGYIGIASIFILIGNIVYKFIRFVNDKELTLYFTCILAYLLNATGNFISQIAISGMLIILFYGMFEGRWRELYGKITPTSQGA